MNKKVAHTILIIGDLLCFIGLWYGYQTFLRIFGEITHNAETIRYGNRIGFFVVCIGLPLIHLLVFIERFRPDLIKKYMKAINQTLIGMIILLIAAGFAGSMWINTKVENAGYIYCSKASGVGATSKTLVYTRNMQICEDLVAEKKARCN